MMGPLTLALVLFAIMLALMAVRVPIAASMFAAGVVGYVIKAGWLPLASFLKSYAFGRFSSYDLSVIPLFLLMGQFATQGGLSRALFRFASVVFGRFKGGLAMAAIVACALFGSVCGSSVATTAMRASCPPPPWPQGERWAS
jgi:C4-dicarboxylate transporter DctM subunit